MATIAEGDAVEAYWPDDDCWLAAVFSALNDDGSLRVTWEDGSISDVTADFVRKVVADEEAAEEELADEAVAEEAVVEEAAEEEAVVEEAVEEEAVEEEAVEEEEEAAEAPLPPPRKSPEDLDDLLEEAAEDAVVEEVVEIVEEEAAAESAAVVEDEVLPDMGSVEEGAVEEGADAEAADTAVAEEAEVEVEETSVEGPALAEEFQSAAMEVEEPEEPAAEEETIVLDDTQEEAIVHEIPDSPDDTIDDDKPGYLFLCNSAMAEECENLRVFGAPLAELPRMKAGIGPLSHLFLYNYESQKLLGTYVAFGDPDKDIEPDAFGGKFNAQVCVAPLREPLRDVACKFRIPPGPKTVDEVKRLARILKTGESGSSWVPNGNMTMPRAKSAVGMPRPKSMASGLSRTPSGLLVSPESPAAGEPGAYVFTCNNATEPECARLKMLGSPERELAMMKRHIGPETLLYLVNFQCLKLYGPFIPDGLPDRNIMPNAFGRRFPAQVRVLPAESPVQEVQLERRMASGAKNAQELNSIKLLFESRAQDAFSDNIWQEAAASADEPPLKRLKSSPSQDFGKFGAQPSRPAMPKPMAHLRNFAEPIAPFSPHQRMPSMGSTSPIASPSPIQRQQAGMDKEGREYNLDQVVVNFANVGAHYATRVLKRKKEMGHRMFDWEGVRRCVKSLAQEHGMRVVGVVFENLWGPDTGRGSPSGSVGIPDDVRNMCYSVQETPCLTGRNHKSADDEMTIKCAYRRNCRFMDNDNYRDWLREMKDPKIRVWLESCQELLQMRYFFDSDLGSFETLDGNIPAGLLCPKSPN